MKGFGLSLLPERKDRVSDELPVAAAERAVIEQCHVFVLRLEKVTLNQGWFYRAVGRAKNVLVVIVARFQQKCAFVCLRQFIILQAIRRDGFGGSPKSLQQTFCARDFR